MLRHGLALARQLEARPVEEELLDLVAVGRTYSEIARTLMISEKTVSTHVSHLLAKTGTSSRVELAGLVHRVSDERDRID